MKRKSKLILLLVLFVPAVCALIIGFNLFFPKALLSCIEIFNVLLLFAIVLYLVRPSNWRPIDQRMHPVMDVFHWMGKIVAVECFMALLFFASAFLLNKTILLPQGLHVSATSGLLDRWLFPWSGLALLAVIMAHQSYRRNVTSLLSPFSSHAVKLITAIYVRLAFRLFVSISMVVLAIYLTLFFRPTFTVLNPAISFIAVPVMLFLLSRPRNTRLASRANQNKVFVGFFVFFIMILFVITFIASDWIAIHWLLPRTKIATIAPLLLTRSFLSTRQSWQLLLWGLWMLLLPFFGSWIAALSKGRSVMQILVAVLWLPLVVMGIYYAGWFSFDIAISPAVLLLLAIVVEIAFFVFLSRRAGLSYLYFGFMPSHADAKTHFSDLNQIGLFAIVIAGLLFMSGFGLLQLLIMLLALPLLLITIMNAWRSC